MLPIALFDLLGTVGTTVGLELAGSAIFGIIMGSITVWTALFTRLIMGQRQSATRLVGIAIVVSGLALPMSEYRVDHDNDGRAELLWGVLACMHTHTRTHTHTHTQHVAHAHAHAHAHVLAHAACMPHACMHVRRWR